MLIIHGSDYAWIIVWLLSDAESKTRYVDNKLVNGMDPYELGKTEWQDNVDLCPAITHVHVCMYLILTPSPYSQNDMLNYKSLTKALSGAG